MSKSYLKVGSSSMIEFLQKTNKNPRTPLPFFVKGKLSVSHDSMKVWFFRVMCLLHGSKFTLRVPSIIVIPILYYNKRVHIENLTFFNCSGIRQNGIFHQHSWKHAHHVAANPSSRNLVGFYFLSKNNQQLLIFLVSHTWTDFK